MRYKNHKLGIANYITICLLIVFSTCNQIPDIYDISGEKIVVYPDYTDLVIPVNIAPLNFMIAGSEKVIANYQGKHGRLTVSGKDKIKIPVGKWKNILKENVKDTLWLELLVKKSGKWMGYPKTWYFVSPDLMDQYVAYRSIPPGYNEWNQMGLYQRNIESFDEEPIITNASTKKNCMNCHTFCMNDPDAMVFHMRQKYGGTYLLKDQALSKLSTKTDYTISNCVYPYWHPSGKFIAFSTNSTAQSIHARPDLNIEVYDSASDIVILDIERNELFTNILISTQGAMETYPAFSSDGKKLFFCTSAVPKDLLEEYNRIRYSLCSIDFDPQSKTFGTRVDTLISSHITHKSVTFAHPSPDGKYILCTLSDYGCFPSWNDESDLYLYDLATSGLNCLQDINSPNAESFTSWSSNSNWIVFSSRREDRQYNKLYFSHIDPSGNASKVFLLPQENPESNIMNLYAYNKPEFIKGKVTLKSTEIIKVAKTKSIPVTFTGKKERKTEIQQAGQGVN